MKFNEVLPALKAGKKIRKNWWSEDSYIAIGINGQEAISWGSDGSAYPFGISDFEKDNWEIVKESKKVKFRDLTKEQYGKWIKNNCTRKYGENCEGCPFRITKCSTWNNSCWINHKESFSDKFLDQEIEIEVEEDEI